VAALRAWDADDTVGAVVMTGTGDRSFSAGQDFTEAHSFDGEGAEVWIREWETFYSTLRRLRKPIIAALNGIAAGSAFQVALLCDLRIAHPGVKMGQPEIDSGIASITGTWIMKEMLGMSRTIELTLTGRMMLADECERIGLVHHLVPPAEVLARSLQLAGELAAKAPLAMRLDRAWFADMTEAAFQQTIDAAIRSHRESYESGEPARYMEKFMALHGHTLGD
uniref:enoyl-CoA hydratase/isomerase family protein n=1 Tax=Gemmatimonas sp. TaxID=1962908 RepID=UPI00356AE2CD